MLENEERMTRTSITTGSAFEQMGGYSRAIVQEPWCFVSGTTGYDYTTMSLPEDVETQTKACLHTIGAVLERAGFALQDVVRATYIVTKAEYAELVLKIAGTYFKEVRPAATIFVASLLRPEMKVEIEVTAMRHSQPVNTQPLFDA
jgi:enamine deaminase RidA (YjgF/YER057c/UK114 family)